MRFVPTLSHSSMVLKLVGVAETALSAEAKKKKIYIVNKIKVLSIFLFYHFVY